MRKPSKRDEYNKRMDALAIAVGKTLDGVSLIEVATICAGVTAFAISDLPADRRKKLKALNTLIEFMRSVIDGNTVIEWERSNDLPQ